MTIQRIAQEAKPSGWKIELKILRAKISVDTFSSINNSPFYKTPFIAQTHYSQLIKSQTFYC